MFRYNLKSAFRYFLIQKMFMGINLLGLVIAFAVSSLIMLYIINELKYDQEHKNSKRIYRVLNKIESTATTDALTTLDLGPLIKENMPEVEKMSRMKDLKSSIVVNDEEIQASSLFVDNDFVEMFTLKGKEKVSSSLLDEPNSVLITEKIATKVFGNEYPIGKDIKLNFAKGEYFFKVIGVINNFSKFSTVKGDLLINFQFYHKNLCDAFLESYPFFTTFLMVPSGTDISLLEEKINKANVESWTGIRTSKYELQKFSRMYLHSYYLSNTFFAEGNARILYGLVFLIVLVVLTACLNFGILSTACALSRSKEIGVRKITGASVKQVKKQVMFESYLLAIMALPLSFIITKFLLPWFNSFFNRELELRFLENLPFTLSILVLMILTATVSGLFTSMSTVKMTPISLLKKENTKLKSGINLNKLLLTGQMVVVIWFLAFAFLIFKQINFALSKGLGYDPENVLKVTVNAPAEWVKENLNFYNPKFQNQDKLEDLKNRLKSYPEITGVSMVYEAPPLRDQLGSGGLKLKRTNEMFRMAGISGDANFAQFMGYRLKEGRYLSESNAGDAQYEVLLNETAAKFMGLENPVGEKLDMGNGSTGEIVGVVYDFNFQSMRKAIVPVSIYKIRGYLSPFDVMIRYQPEKGNEALADFNSAFNNLYKNYETEPVFHEDQIKALYETEITEARVITLGIVLAVFIAIMGIFGISLFSIRQRVKEIGVRKINGAGTQSILTLINGNIARWIGVSFAIAAPLAWFSMHKWLENFAYKTSLSWWIFALAGLMALGIALLTVSWQSWRAATRNPVDALKYE